ncbi:hypothetical protein DIE11_03790 [Burkholderia sp. Bp9012]|uniref:hypothetical protein n=1 Tax=Burkholderia sp. Bp9012 TaxID=2184562 RepID=UPI000F59A807|nr:hypothetical protein [Burkholderia sp. Bp9012]RQR87059.1 hypothetical protein DIE11_03790 [Burkholderia sp. Bp9012]
MDEIEELDERLDSDPDVDGVRLDIADLLGRLIGERRDYLSYWEKFWFVQALVSLDGNIQRGQRDSTAFLRVTLLAIANALRPAQERDENYAPHRADIEAVTAELLLEYVRTLGGAA